MKDELGDSYRKIFAEAFHVLNSREIQKAAKEERELFQALLERDPIRTMVRLDYLKKTVEEGTNQLFADFVEAQPRLRSLLRNHWSNLIEHWIFTYLQHVASVTTEPKSIANDYAHAFVKDVTKNKLTFREITPLYNFSADQEFSLEAMAPEGDLLVKFVKQDNRTDPRSLGFHFFPKPPSPESAETPDLASRWPYQWVLFVDKAVWRKEKYFGDEQLKFGHWTHQILTELRLFKDQEFQTINTYRSVDALYFPSGNTIVRGGFSALPHGDKYHLSKTDFESYKEFCRKLEKFMPFDDTLPPRIAMAIRYFESSAPKPLHERFLDLSISLEALFAISSENTYRLPIRVATFLHLHNKLARKMFETVKELWKIRNKLAHGSLDVKNAKHWADLRMKTPKLRKIVRLSINKHLDLFSSLGNDNDLYERYMERDFEKIHVVGRGSLSTKELSKYKQERLLD